MPLPLETPLFTNLIEISIGRDLGAPKGSCMRLALEGAVFHRVT